MRKPRSPAPGSLKSSAPRTYSKSPKFSPKPTSGAARRHPSKDTRSPLRSVSNVSKASTQSEFDGTVQIKTKKDKDIKEDTPEWRRRLVRGEIAGEQRDLFAPMGLESVFKPPTPGAATAQQGSTPFTKQEDHLWDFADTPSRQDGDERNSHDDDLERIVNEDGRESGDRSPERPIIRALWGTNGGMDVYWDQEGFSQAGNTQLRTASGLEDLRNEGITPITFTRNNTVDGNGTAEVIKSALKQVTSKLESLSVEHDSRLDSPASDSFLFYNYSEPHPDGSPRDDSLLDVTSHSLPQDLSMGTVDFNSRRGNRSFPRRFSPSPFPSHRMSPATLANSKVRSSPLFNPLHKTTSPVLPRPSSSNVRPSTAGAEYKLKMPSSGSPLKLFGDHDTFTNNRLLRRMSQFEDNFSDTSEGEEPPSPSEEARRKGENRSFLSSRHGPLQEISPRRNERLGSRNAVHRISQFGGGELDKFDFSDTSPYEHKLVYDAAGGFGSRPSSRKRSSTRQKYLRGPSQQGLYHYSRSASSGFTRKPSAWRQDFFDEAQHGTRSHNKENMAPDVKRVPRAPGMDPTPKRRRTIMRDNSAELFHNASGGSPQKYGDSMSLLQRSLLQHGVQLENSDYLAPPGLSQSRQRPRTPTPSQIRTDGESYIGPHRDFSECNFENNDYSDSFSLDGDVPLVKITGTSDTSRKGSITTQDYLNEATKIMDLIRSKGRGAAGLTSVHESDMESEGDDFSDDDESTREAFSRPPSRDGTDLRKLREAKELNPLILSHLQKYQEQDDPNDREMSLHARQGQDEGQTELGESNSQSIRIRGPRKRKTSGMNDDTAENIAQDLMTINTHMSGFSVTSVPTGSSQSSQVKGMLASDLVAHLIPNEVNGFKYDRLKNQWVRDDVEEPKAPISEPAEEADDPFRDIPDLSVDEIQEMMRVHGLNSPTKSDLQADQERLRARSSLPANASPKKPDVRPHTRDGDLTLGASSVLPKPTRFTSSAPNTGTRATSWGTDKAEPIKTSEQRKSEAQREEPLSSKSPRSPGKQARVATVNLSSPLVSRPSSRGEPDDDQSDPSANHAYRGIVSEEDTVPADQENDSTRSFVPPTGRQTSVGGRPFIRRPISRIDERNEETVDEKSLIRRNDSLRVQETPARTHARHFLMPLQSAGPDTSYSFHLSPLADFTVNQGDKPLKLEMSCVAQRTNPSSLRKVRGAFALATEDLIKHITDVEPYEPYWENVRCLVLRQKRLITLHKLNEFCPRLEELDVSDNDIGQLSGVPSTLRTLKIPRNCLSNLTPWSHMINLQYLDVSGNDIETLDGFASLIHLRELKANDNQICNIDGITSLNGLLSLKLSNNSITAVDFKGSELTRLRDLDLSHNCLASVRNVEWLPSLATLDLSANQISHFDSSAPLISLRALKLSENQLEAFDTRTFPSVSLLYLDQNHLSTVLGLENCHNLEVLSLREQASSKEKGLDHRVNIDLGLVKDVRKVFLSSNKLSPQTVCPSAPLLRLQLLDVAACTLKSLPGDFALSFPNLKVLNLNFNSVDDVEPLVGMNCLARLMIVGNRLSRMRRVCQILSRLGKTGKGTACSLRKLDLRGNPLNVGFYPPAVTGSGNADLKKLKSQEQAVVRHQGTHRDLSDALAEIGNDDQISHRDMGDEPKTDRDIEIDDPYTLPLADPQADLKYLRHLDQATRLRRRVLELLLYAGTSGSLHTLDGLDLRPSLGDDSSDMNKAWDRLEHLGVLRRKALKN
ncbi:putative leucine-rich repeat protein [Penicillium digitatum]|uniref:Putative leucine-rich repeat protein n=3 Tax=Penicillium digitatum TaxID=36651 RepID=K9GTD2_PEND2|nr:putative leucine-rich repeat protein [Penicillium digitatum Pd1]EKV15876.1 putative leucine-rich repeat protein [Penicillium digitatum Pd1]EKV17848.1 putative leucine-rich repeat protein [Penicillium digitatum PHI26]QQK42343.1 putative leucine-rich repeat protein [Penicillium digitatum]